MKFQFFLFPFRLKARKFEILFSLLACFTFKGKKKFIAFRLETKGKQSFGGEKIEQISYRKRSNN